MPSNTPLQITLTANDGSNHIYISADTSLNVMTLTLTNTTTANIVFQQYTGGGFAINELPAGNSGIYLLFNGLLSNAIISGMSITAPGWAVQMQQNNQSGEYLVLLPSSNISLAPGDSINFTLGFPVITGSANSGYFSCQYVNVQAGLPVSGGEQLYVMLVYPPRTDGSAPAALPVQFEFIGSNIVYNGGIINQLSFRVTNTSDAPLIPGGTASWGSSTPQFKLHFIQDNSSTAGSLLTNSQAGSVNISIQQLYQNKLCIEKEPSTTPQFWIIEEDETLLGTDGTILGTGASASVSFMASSIITGVAGSITMAVLEYSGFPGYEDGQLTAEIQVKDAPPADPVISSFSAASYLINIINTGNNISIAWNVLNATNVTIFKDGERMYSGSLMNATTGAIINHTTNFTLTAYNADQKSVSQTFIIQVDTVPIGTIMMWHGLLSTLPVGWHVCDGTNNTPDLRERFVLGASGDSSGSIIQPAPNTNPLHYLNTSGGGNTHTHSVTTYTQNFTTNKDGEHGHRITFDKTKDVSSGSNNSNSYYHGDGDQGTDNDATNSLHSHTFTIPQLTGSAQAANADLPRYYALYFIMKCS